MKKKPRSLNVFFAGELFNLKHLIGNAYLAEAIYEKSHGRYLCQLPQDFDRAERPEDGPRPPRAEPDGLRPCAL